MSDGDLALAEIIRIAAESGMKIGIADHVSARFPDHFVSNAERLESYLAALDAGPLLRSAELCWCDPFSESVAHELHEKLDYLIGSNHGFALPDGSMGSPWWKELPPTWRDRPQELMELLVRNLCDLVSKMPIDIVAHSTFIPEALFAIDPEVENWWTGEREDRFIEAAVSAGVAIEISNRYRLPHARFLKKAREAGAKFTLGSDAHHRDQVGRLEWSVDAATAAGISEADLFTPEARDG